jgi:hypothetical protein
MKTRQHFLHWLEQSKILDTIHVQAKRFYEVRESEYVFQFLHGLLGQSDELIPYTKDFISLEEQRYRILKNDIANSETFLEEKARAIQFASLSDKEKRKSRFQMNPNLRQFLATSEYAWDRLINDQVEHKKRSYFFIPSFLPMMPKEVHLADLNAVFLDLIDFEEVFSFDEFFNLIRQSLDFSDEELDETLLEFLSSQVLYYDTIRFVS